MEKNMERSEWQALVIKMGKCQLQVSMEEQKGSLSFHELK